MFANKVRNTVMAAMLAIGLIPTAASAQVEVVRARVAFRDRVAFRENIRFRDPVRVSVTERLRIADRYRVADRYRIVEERRVHWLREHAREREVACVRYDHGMRERCYVEWENAHRSYWLR